jgi:murein DD-endopeptidase MepM/ murein hydrolase activator NlpD
MELSSIYAWTIDFFRIQKGDHFKIVYEEKFVENEFIGIGRVYAALFNHANEDFYAFYFEEEENYGDYFDDEGAALRKAFLRAPLNYSRISSSYSKRRKHPVTGRIKAHLGTDYAAPTGTPILSTANGTVTEARYKRNNGNYVKVRHNSTYSTQYLHMSKIKSGIRPGVYVKQGEVIGYVGSTGLATGPHVCYRFWKNGRQVDPYKQKLPPSKPVKKENLEAYTMLKDSMMNIIQSIPSNY